MTSLPSGHVLWREHGVNVDSSSLVLPLFLLLAHLALNLSIDGRKFVHHIPSNSGRGCGKRGIGETFQVVFTPSAIVQRLGGFDGVLLSIKW